MKITYLLAMSDLICVLILSNQFPYHHQQFQRIIFQGQFFVALAGLVVVKHPQSNLNAFFIFITLRNNDLN